MDIVSVEYGLPDYPAAPDGLSTAAAAINREVIWERLESWTNYKWGIRENVYRINTPREIMWSPPELPFTITELDGDPVSPDWAIKLTAGAHMVTAEIGDAEPRETVKEAYRRLAEYYAATDTAPPGAQRHSVRIGDIAETYSRRADHMARAMQNSGAADLLRKYRRAGIGHS